MNWHNFFRRDPRSHWLSRARPHAHAQKYSEPPSTLSSTPLT